MTAPATSPDPTQPVHDPLACPGVTAILLSEAASRRLRLEADCFAIVGKGSYPASPGRMVIYCQAIGPNISADVCKILRGGFKAIPIKPSKIQPEQTAPAEPAKRGAYHRGDSDGGVETDERTEARLKAELGNIEEMNERIEEWLADRETLRDSSHGEWSGADQCEAPRRFIKRGVQP